MSRSSQVTKEKEMFPPPPPPLWSVAKLTELLDNKIISAQDQLYYFLDWTTLLTLVIVSLNRHGFFYHLSSLPFTGKLDKLLIQGSQKGPRPPPENTYYKFLL